MTPVGYVRSDRRILPFRIGIYSWQHVLAEVLLGIFVIFTIQNTYAIGKIYYGYLKSENAKRMRIIN